LKLTSAHVTNFKSIEDSDELSLDDAITVLVGQNESGKTAFLQALNKARSVDADVKYDYIEDYPRRHLNRYEAQHKTRPAEVTELTFSLEADDISLINDFVGFSLLDELNFSLTHKYDNRSSVSIDIPEGPYVQHRVQQANLSTEVRQKVSNASTVSELVSALKDLDLNDEEMTLLDDLEVTFMQKVRWQGRALEQHIYDNIIEPGIPKFLYFDDYYLLPGKINLTDLEQRINGTSNKSMRDEDKTARSLLRLAGVDLSTLTTPTGYESIRAKLEGISNTITDKIFEYWTQNRELDVEFDIRADPTDEAPFDQGSNLYIRIRNRRHRVTVPFSQRSKGFIWFFSFITWFDSIQKDTDGGDRLILLLDEPGLSLHALAQADFLRYIDELAVQHQILYTTHSPFMIHSDRLHQVRTVEDRDHQGTKISDNVSSSDAKTIFPLQAALGYGIAQNLFISRRNLLVEGPADLIYLQFFSNMLQSSARTSLRDDITIVPVGGLDKLATFVALLKGNDLELSVLHDYETKPDPRLESLVREKLVRNKQVLNYAMFRGVSKTGIATKNLVSTDVEDLISPSAYLGLFNAAYAKELGGMKIRVGDLPPGDRIVVRIGQYLSTNSIQLRKSGGFNHYLVANHLASHPLAPSKLDIPTLANFEGLFETVNMLYSEE
jgi:predicted ATPase